MDESSELEGKLIQCKFCNDQSIYESKTLYLETRLTELNKDLDNTEININLKKKEHQEKIDQLHNDLKIKNDELEKQTLLQNNINDFENRLKKTEKLNSEELDLGNEINKIKNKIRTTTENISSKNKDIEKKTNYLETKIISYNNNENIEQQKEILNNHKSESDNGEIVNINKNLNMHSKENKSESEENKKIKKYKFFSPRFIK